jgi:hypothetical protein
VTDIHRLFDDSSCGSGPPTEESSRSVQVRMSPAKQGNPDERALDIEIGRLFGFTRARGMARLQQLKEDEAAEDAKEKARKDAAKAAADERDRVAKERKQKEAAESLVRREMWLAEEGKR